MTKHYFTSWSPHNKSVKSDTALLTSTINNLTTSHSSLSEAGRRHKQTTTESAETFHHWSEVHKSYQRNLSRKHRTLHTFVWRRDRIPPTQIALLVSLLVRRSRKTGLATTNLQLWAGSPYSPHNFSWWHYLVVDNNKPTSSPGDITRIVSWPLNL